ncbi:hypothetical protein ACLOAV_008480 [Pseudogymnoascus australis]
MLDESHPTLPPQNDDPNDYSFGRIGDHNLVIACLPAGNMGNTPATTVANNMKRSFPIKFGLMVGIGGGVPSKKSDIRLGDVAVSQPTGSHGGVFQWDYGKTEQGGKFHRSGTLNKPPMALLHALQSLKIHDINKGIPLEDALTTMATNNPRMVEEFGYEYQGADEDQLFQSAYDHATGETKTQMALEFTYYWQQKTSGSVFWVRGDTEASFSQGYSEIGKAAGISLDLKGEDLLLAVQEWIEQLPNWLLVLDNVDNLRIFKELYGHQNKDPSPNPELLRFVPRQNGIVLWTSRDNSILGKLVDSSRGVEVQGMSDQEALGLFQSRSGRPRSKEPCDEERELLNLLENLPLAVSQSAAYIRSTRSTVKLYIETLKKSETDLYKRLDFEFPEVRRQSDMPNSVMKTWLISMSQIARESHCAERVLNTIAYLDNQGLPFEVLSAAAGDGFDDDEVREAAGRLVDYSFLQAQITGEATHPTYQEHRLVQLATRQVLTKASQNSEFSGNAIRIMKNLFPSGYHETWSSCRVYLPHALKSILWKEADGYVSLALGLLVKIGRYYWEEGRSNEAEQLLLQ